MPNAKDYRDYKPSALMREAIDSVETAGVMTPVKWAAQFISDLSLHVVKEDYEALEKIKAQSDEIPGIRATLLVNFGEGREHNKYGFHVSENESTHAMLITVLKGLTNNLAATQRVAGQAKSMAEANTILRKIAAYVPGRVWMKAKEDAGHGTEIKANITDPKVDEAELDKQLTKRKAKKTSKEA